jgi:4'-phosphopantetheinyl transferase
MSRPAETTVTAPEIYERAWAVGPARPRLAEGAVHVWRADLDRAGDGPLELLSDDERKRSAAGLRSRQSDRLTRARGILRELLGRYLGGDPRELRFTAGPHGKPALNGGELHFSLSHSGEQALYAVSAGCEVGVDVERERERDPVIEARLAARLVGDERARALEELSPQARRRELLDAWTRYEAEVKCRGTGIGDGLPLGAVAEPRCWVSQLDLGPGLSAAVAAEQPISELRCFSWQDASVAQRPRR